MHIKVSKDTLASAEGLFQKIYQFQFKHQKLP